MIAFKCKMCGGDLSFEPGASVAECPYCGTMQTLPKLDDDRWANLYDRANHFRRQNEYDKAAAIYEQILAEDRTDAEAYWSLVLCRYGIEYVEDPASHKRVPTVNCVQYASILADEDYKSALQYADARQRGVYEAEAAAIAEIQKGILDISKQEQPFDVFICYKETDANGRRTPDSVLATELYHELTKEGFKVFFARITLEDKIGSAYEPYIFAALNSARVMVALGTKPEHFNAVWVKNEWSRYLALIRAGADKTLVPAYRDMDPYDLPEEFAHLQALDMGKLGFMQDLTRGIRKILRKDTPKAHADSRQMSSSAADNAAPLLERAFILLEDGDFVKADEFCERVLNLDPKNGNAYLAKLMAKLKVRRAEDLRNRVFPFDGNSEYRNIMRFGSDSLKRQIQDDIQHIKNNPAAHEDFRAPLTVPWGVRMEGIVYKGILLPWNQIDRISVFNRPKSSLFNGVYQVSVGRRVYSLAFQYKDRDRAGRAFDYINAALNEARVCESKANPQPSAAMPKKPASVKARKRGHPVIVAILLIVIISGIVRFVGQSPDHSDSVWADSVTPITSFDYYVDGDYVFLKDFTGREKKVWIGTIYRIGDKDYIVADTIEDLFVFSHATSVILPDGIKHMPNNTFNSCSVKYLYIPKTLQPDDNSYSFYDYFHGMEKIYYGGNEAEWAVLTKNAKRSDIDVKEIVYNSTIQDIVPRD